MKHNDYFSVDVLEDYLDGKLDAKAMHQLEKLSLEDPFVAEALAGLSQSPKRLQSLSLLQKQLQQRIAQKPIAAKRWRFTSQRLSIAAAAAVLFVTVSLLFWMKEDKRRALIANRSKDVAVDIAPQVAHVAPNKPDLITEPAASTAVLVKKKATPISAAKNRTPIDVAIAAIPEQTNSGVMVSADSKPLAFDTLGGIAMNKQASRSVSAAQVLMEKTAAVVVPFKTMSGKVVSSANGQPIAGADVEIINSNLKTKTNALGEFVLPMDTLGNASVAIKNVGYNSRQVKANSSLTVELEPAQTLSEVVVTRVKPITKARPLLGWEKFEIYLSENNKILKKGRSTQTVTLTFKILANGRPSDIKVKKGLGEAENEEAIRLLSEGPNWVNPPQSTKSTTVTIKF